MKRRSTFLLLSVPFVLLACGSAEARAQTASGDSAYAIGDHRSALDHYGVLARTYSSPGLYYNIGNCHFKLGNKGQAVLWYERAHRLAPGDADINANLDLARTLVVDRVNASPGIALGGQWTSFRAGADVDTWAKRSLWLCLATFLCIAVLRAIRSQALHRVLTGIAGVLGVCTALAIALAAYRTMEVRNESEAIIMAPKVDVRSEPRDGGLAVFVLHEGTKLTVQQVRDSWCEVRLANGNVGWMKSADLERI